MEKEISSMITVIETASRPRTMAIEAKDIPMWQAFRGRIGNISHVFIKAPASDGPTYRIYPLTGVLPEKLFTIGYTWTPSSGWDVAIDSYEPMNMEIRVFGDA